MLNTFFFDVSQLTAHIPFGLCVLLSAPRPISKKNIFLGQLRSRVCNYFDCFAHLLFFPVRELSMTAIGTLFKVKRLIIKKVLFAQGFTHPASGCNHDTLPKNYLKNMIERVPVNER
jgi:hypothetical protein